MSRIVNWLSTWLVFAHVLYGGGFALADTQLAGSDWRSRQEKFWNKSHILFDAIVALARASTVAQLQSDPTLNGPITDSTLELLLLFDDDGSQRALSALARLSSYYLGEAPGEVYQCVVVRKGPAILAALRAQLKARNNDCVSRYGEEDPVCRRDDQHRERVKALIEAISADRPCTIER